MKQSIDHQRNVYFLYPGQGSEKVNMTRALYENLTVYRNQLDQCMEAITNLSNFGVRDILFPERNKFSRAQGQLRDTAVIQPTLFAVEYSLSKALIDLGIEPSGMIGHSVGEYVAACLAGVFSIETGLEIIIKRGQLVQDMPRGSMLAVAIPAEEASQYLTDRISLASINGPQQCVFSGFPDAIDSLVNQLKTKSIVSKRLHVTRAFHSMMLDPVLDRFGEFIENKTLQRPSKPFISCVHGRWADPAEVCQAEYWVRQLREPVRFFEGVNELMANPNSVFLEVGPRGSLANLVKGNPGYSESQCCLSICPGHYSKTSELHCFRESLLQMEAVGIPVNRDRLPDHQQHPVSKERCTDNNDDELQNKITPPDKERLSELEQQVAGWFYRILGVPDIDLNQNFLEAGGNSLMAMQVISRIRESYQIFVPIKLFFDKPTVKGVARLVATLPKENFNSDHQNASFRESVEPTKPIEERQQSTPPGLEAGTNGNSRNTNQSVDFSLFFFAGDEGEKPDDRYGLVMDAARFADKAGFASIWLPERHFNKFGGLYPNPSVLGAAIAAVTKRIHICGGSVVAPLHHPVRIAEEWSVVDNLSKGRIGIAFGSGFHPNDFLLAPDAFNNRKENMFASIASIRNLWKGGRYRGLSGTGDEIEKEIFPKPYSKNLPIWLATSRSKETFAEAGEIGAGVLTALLRLSVPELEERIAIYREALRKAGYDPSIGRVTVMLHTFLGPNIEFVRSKVKAPLMAYLRSHMEHTRAVSHEKAGNTDDVKLSADEEEALLDYALERYLKTSSLLGTEDSCLETVQRLEQIGVDELACLVDFGVDQESIMSSLGYLERLHERVAKPIQSKRDCHQLHDENCFSVKPSRGNSMKRTPLSTEMDNLRGLGSGGAALHRIERTKLYRLPLSFAQQRLWFLEQMEGELTAYNMPYAWRLKGPLNVDALRWALETIIGRHEALRTNFAMIDGELEQMIGTVNRFELPAEDLRSLESEQLEVEIKRRCLSEAERPFDLTRDRMLRACLLELTEDKNILMLTMHHIASDGWSRRVFWRELQHLYNAGCRRANAELPELPLQYVDYAVWQRSELRGSRLGILLKYWLKQLKGAAPLEMPTDRPRPAKPTYRGARHDFALPEELVNRLNSLSQAEGVTLHMTLLAAFQTLLSRYSSQNDIVVGMPVPGRNHTALEEMIGFFVNTLVLRTDLSGEPTFRELLGRVRQISLSAYDHQDLPFERLVEELQPARDLDRNPLVQVMFQLQNFDTTDTNLGDLEISPMPSTSVRVRFDLEMHLWQDPKQLCGAIIYSIDLFEAPTIERIVAHFVTLLTGIVADPDQRLSELPLLTERERRQMLVEWNDTAVDYPYARCVHELFEEQVERTPDSVAIVFGNRELSYRELNESANQLAHHLQGLGVGPKALVGLYVERSAELVVGILGILKIGAAYLPLDAEDPPQRLETMLADAEVNVLVTQHQLLRRLPASHALAVCLDADASNLEHLDRSNPAVAVSADDLAYVMYTSGSTGQPKGVEVRHRSIARLVFGTDFATFGPDRVFAHLANASFDASTFELWGALLHGSKLVVAPAGPPDFRNLEDLFKQNGVTTLWLTASLFNQVVEQYPEALVGIEEILTGGEALSVRHVCLAQQALGSDVQLINGYGPTESTTFTACYRIPSHLTPELESIPIGRPIANTQAYVLDAERNPVPIGFPGELYIGGLGLARGYLNRPELIVEKFVANPFDDDPKSRLYRTGDRCRWRVDGNLEFLGRLDDQIKLRGYRIELGEIEAALTKHAEVSQAVAILREDLAENRSLVAYIVPDADTTGQVHIEQHIDDWLNLYDRTYRDESVESTGPDFNITGWNSSYTDAPIQAGEMAEWIDATVARIRQYRPNRLLEIGCGTGLLLARLAPECQGYTGTDFSVSAQRHIERLIASSDKLKHVQFSLRQANDFTGIEPQSFDTIIINSVTQYLPSIEYVKTVLERAVRAVAPGGRILIGDVRSLPLLKAFHASVHWHRAKDSATFNQLSDRIIRSMEQDEELVISPLFFQALQSHVARISHVDVMIKRGMHHNELTRFRYDVFLHVESAVEPSPVEASWDWQRESGSRNVEALSQALSIDRLRSLGIRRIPNARLAVETQLLSHLADDEFASQDVGTLRPSLTADDGCAADPQALCDLADTYGYALEMRDARAFGHLDALFRRRDADDNSLLQSRAPYWPRQESAEEPTIGHTWSVYSNNPLWGKVVRDLVPRLRDHAQQRLPKYMIPSAFFPLETLPLTPNGKINRKDLPTIGLESLTSETFVAPRSSAEKELSTIWASLLGLDQIGIHHNFFELGGHSLLATQVISRIRKSFSIELPLRTLFETPTIAGLGTKVEQLLTQSSNHHLPSIEPINRQEKLLLSFAQQRLWFLDQLEENSATYNIATAFELRGALDVRALEKAIQTLIQRHQTLRTCFHKEGGTPIQVIVTEVNFNLVIHDLQTHSENQQAAEVKQLVKEEAQKPFDLSLAPLIRVSLLRLRSNVYVLMLTMHHIISDGWSMGILKQELSILYQAYDQGKANPLAELPIQYVDFSHWQRQWLEGHVLQRQLKYWKQQLADAPPILELSADHPRPSMQSYQGGIVHFNLSPHLTRKLKNLSHQADSTLYMTLLAGFATILYRYTNQEDIVIGSPIANRRRSEVESIIGFFVNTLALRIKLKDSLSFFQLIIAVRQISLDAYAHQDLPFEKLVEELQPERSLSYSPLFQVMFILQNAPKKKFELANITLTPLIIHTETAKFDLTLSLTETDGELKGAFEYSKDLFDEDRIERMVRHFQTLLERVVANPQEKISQTPILRKAERQQLLVEWNKTKSDYPQDKCIHHLFEEQVQRTPHDIAVAFEDKHLTYMQLNKQANQVAHYLKKHGAGPNTPVGIYMDRSLNMMVAVLGILKSRAACLPLDTSYPKDRITYMLANSQASLVFAEANHSEKLSDQDSNILYLSLEMKAISAESVKNPIGSGVFEDLVYVIYTSGSTGKPKGVALPHRALANLITWHLTSPSLVRGLRTLQFSSLSFDVSFQEMFTTWCSGGTLVLVADVVRRDVERLAIFIHAQGIERLFVPFVILQELAEALNARKKVSLQEIITAGEQLQITEPLIQFFNRFRNCTLHNHYGPSESHVVASFSLQGKPENWPTLPPIGVPISNTQIHLLDNRMQPVPIGIPGEIFIGGDGLARDYLNRLELTKEKFIPNPFSDKLNAKLYRSGDLGRYLPDGNIEFLGRSDHQVKIRGYRIELGEIETSLTEHSQISEAIVISTEKNEANKNLIGYFIAKKGKSPSIDSVRDFLRRKLPEYMIPSAFVSLEAFPLTPSGKVDRDALPAPNPINLLSTTFVAPRSPVEEELSRIWASLLGLDQIGIHHNFFELGGHSLLATQVNSRIRKAFSIDIPLRSLFENPTVAELAQQIETIRWVQEASNPVLEAISDNRQEGEV